MLAPTTLLQLETILIATIVIVIFVAVVVVVAYDKHTHTHIHTIQSIQLVGWRAAKYHKQ